MFVSWHDKLQISLDMKAYLFHTLVILATLFSSCAEKTVKKETVQTVQKETIIVKDTVYVKKEEPKVEPVKAAPAYFLITGCFEYKNNADRLCEKLQKEGYKNALVMPYFENLYLVAYEGYATHQEAVTAVRKLHKIPGNEEAWIHPVK